MHCYNNVWRFICTTWRMFMPSWRHYHSIALILGIILPSIICVYLQLHGWNPHLAELMHRKANKDVFSILWHQLRVLCPLLCMLVAVLDGCTVGKNWELLSLLWDARGGAVELVCRLKATPSVRNWPLHEYQISSRGFSFMRCMEDVQYAGWAVVCSFTYKTKDMIQNYHISHVEPRNHRNLSI